MPMGIAHDTPKIYSRYTQDMSKICARKMFPRHAQDMPEIWLVLGLVLVGHPFFWLVTLTTAPEDGAVGRKVLRRKWIWETFWQGLLYKRTSNFLWLLFRSIGPATGGLIEEKEIMFILNVLRKVSRKKSCCSFGFCPNYTPPFGQLWIRKSESEKTKIYISLTNEVEEHCESLCFWNEFLDSKGKKLVVSILVC